MLELTKCLYHILTNSELRWKTIQLTTAHEECNPFITYEADDVLEVGLTKQTYLGLFKECHTYWHKHVAGKVEELVSNADEQKLWDLYFVTLGYLITTNENHTVIYLHEIVTFEIYKKYDKEIIHKDFEIITAYISSRLKRINKSSSLWFWIQKLTILVIYDPWIKGADTTKYYQKLLDRMFKSCQLHFANYYAANFMKWLANINYVLGKNDMGLLEHLTEKCHEHLTDVSLWTSLASILQRGSLHDVLKYNVEMYQEISDQLKKFANLSIQTEKLSLTTHNIQGSNDKPLSFDNSFVMEQLKWLVGVECVVYTPYNVMVSTILIMGKETDIIECGDYLRAIHKQIETELPKFESNSSIHPKKKKYYEVLGKVLEMLI